MKLLKITHRAVFRFPRQGPINPMGLRLPGDFPVEVYEARASQWAARRPDNRAALKIPASASVESAKEAVARAFESKHSEWAMYAGGELIEPAAVHIASDGRVYAYEPEDFTHTIHPDGSVVLRNGGTEPDRRLSRAACGGEFKHDRFASLHAGPPPTCKACAAHVKTKGAAA